MIKIVNVSSDTNIGGAGRCILAFLKNFDRDQFDVSVIVPRSSMLIEQVAQLNIKYYEMDGIGEKSFSVSTIKKFIKIFKRIKPDIVHAHACLSARIAAKLCKIKVVYTRHSVFPNSPFITKGLGKLVTGAVNNSTSDTVIAVADAAKDNLTETGVREDKIRVVKNGVSPLELVDTNEFKEKYNLKDKFVFGMIARVEEIKGHDLFIDAAVNIHQSFPNTAFLICGTGTYYEHIKNKIAELGAEKYIILTGYISDVTTAMNAIDVNVNASFGTEATSLSLLEGMSIGKPIIASNYGGNPELVIEGENGVLFETKNSKDLEDCMKKILENENFYVALSFTAKKIFFEKYTSEIYTKNIENIYSELMKGDNFDEEIQLY